MLINFMENSKAQKSVSNQLFSILSGKVHNHDFYHDLPDNLRYTGAGYGNRPYAGFQPGPPLRHTYPRRHYGTFGSKRGPGSYWSDPAGQQPSKRKVMITVVRNGPSPRNSVKILLNRWGVQSYEQLIKDISEAFGPKWKNNKVRKLFTLRGREVQGVSDFFREDDTFIACGNESLNTHDVADIIEEMYPHSPYAQSLLKDWERKRRKHAYGENSSKKDSGFGSDSSNREDADDDIIYRGRPSKKKARDKNRYDEIDPSSRIELERQRAAEEERERANKRRLKNKDAEQR